MNASEEEKEAEDTAWKQGGDIYKMVENNTESYFINLLAVLDEQIDNLKDFANRYKNTK